MKFIIRPIYLSLLLTMVSCVGQKEQLFPWETNVPHDDIYEMNGRKNLFFDFTGTWCVNCPQMETSISNVQKDSYSTIVPICVHYLDDMHCEASEKLVKAFNIASFPSLIVDMDPGSLTSDSSADIMKAIVHEHLNNYSTSCSIDVSIKKESEEFEITAKLSFDSHGEYSAGAMLLEDGIISAQSGASDSYIHNNVLRGFLQDSIYGDTISFNQDSNDVNCTWLVSIPAINTNEYRIVVYVMDNSFDYPIVINSSSKIRLVV